MKKIFYLVMLVAVSLITCLNVHAVDLNSSVVTDFATAVSSLSNTGFVISTSVAKAHIQTITITYDCVQSTGSLKLYNRLTGGASKTPGSQGTCMYSVNLSTIANVASPIHEKYDIGACPIAINGMTAVHEGGTGKKPHLVVTWW